MGILNHRTLSPQQVRASPAHPGGDDVEGQDSQISDPTVHMSVGNSPACHTCQGAALEMQKQSGNLNATMHLVCKCHTQRSALKELCTRILKHAITHHPMRRSGTQQKAAPDPDGAPMMMSASGKHWHSAPGCLKRHLSSTLQPSVGRFWEALCPKGLSQPASSQTALREEDHPVHTGLEAPDQSETGADYLAKKLAPTGSPRPPAEWFEGVSLPAHIPGDVNQGVTSPGYEQHA